MPAGISALNKNKTYIPFLFLVPGIPLNVDLKTYGQAIVLGWTPPRGSNVTGYDLKWYPSHETDANKHFKKNLAPNKQQTVIRTNLKPLNYYNVELNAYNNAGKGKAWKMLGVVVGKNDGRYNFFL